MLTAVVMALAWFGHDATVHTADHKVAGWTLHVRKDSFTNGVSCSADRGGMVFRNGLVVFSLGRNVDTSDAEYRLDLGSAHSVHEVTLRDRVMGAPLTLEPVNNPSRGLVVLPAADVMEAGEVWIRAYPKAKPRRFVTTGLKDVAEQERLAPCA